MNEDRIILAPVRHDVPLHRRVDWPLVLFVLLYAGVVAFILWCMAKAVPQ